MYLNEIIIIMFLSQLGLTNSLDESFFMNRIYDVFTTYNTKINGLTQMQRQGTVQWNKRPQTLSVLMHFNLDGTSSFNLVDESGIYWSDIGNCAHGQMFDPVSGVCRDIFCIDGFYSSEDGCKTNQTKPITYIPTEIKIELNLNNKLCEPLKDDKEECDSNSIEMTDELKELLRVSLAREIDIDEKRLVEFSVFNKTVLNETQHAINLNSSLESPTKVYKIERFTVAFRILNKIDENEQDSITAYFKLIAHSLINRLFKIDDEQFTISNVVEITENKYLSWCSDPDERQYLLGQGFRILTLPEKAELNHNYYIYVEKDDRLYETGEYVLTIILDPVLSNDTIGWLQSNTEDETEYKSYSSWSKNSSYLDITDYVLNTNSTKVTTNAILVVCAREPKIRNECDENKALRVKKCEFEYSVMTRKYCSNKMNTCFTVNDYEIDPILPETYIRICKDKIDKSHIYAHPFDDETVYDQITSWMSFASIIISIVFLLATLMTYILFKSLRKIPAWNIINLTLALFIAQLSFALGSFLIDNELACFLVAILTHYGYLAAFFWMNVSAFDLYRNFCIRSKQVLLNMVTPRERLPKYLIYGWLGPSIIVLVCLTIDLANDSKIENSLRPCYASYLKGCLQLNNSFESRNINYNQSYPDNSYFNLTSNNETKIDNCFDLDEKNQILSYIFIKSCYIQNGKANLLFFGLPIGLIILINAVFYTLTIYNIRRMKTKTKNNYLRRVSRGKVASDSDVKFYIQMAFTMGFTWIFGFLSSTYTTDRHILLYQILVFCFIISNGLIGILIFIAFICKKDIYLLYKALILEKIFRVKQNHKVQNVYSIKIGNSES